MENVMTLPATFGAKLRQYREGEGYTQEQFAELVGTSWISVHRYETDQRMPRFDEVVKMAEVLGKTLQDFLPITAPSEPSSRSKGKRK